VVIIHMIILARVVMSSPWSRSSRDASSAGVPAPGVSQLRKLAAGDTMNTRRSFEMGATPERRRVLYTAGGLGGSSSAVGIDGVPSASARPSQNRSFSETMIGQVDSAKFGRVWRAPSPRPCRNCAGHPGRGDANARQDGRARWASAPSLICG
jgi:hypothetical protein